MLVRSGCLEMEVVVGAVDVVSRLKSSCSVSRSVKEDVEDLHDPRTEESGSSRGVDGLQMSSAEVLDGNLVRNEFFLG